VLLKTTTRQAEKVPKLSRFQTCGDITRLGRKQQETNNLESGGSERVLTAAGTTNF
jgi:hypothetical protein